MPFNTTAARHVFEARKHLPDSATVCELCLHNLEISDHFIHWLIRQSERYPFVNAELLAPLLKLPRADRRPHADRFYEAIGFGSRTILDSHSRRNALVVDFNLPFRSALGAERTFDLIDNSGTTEHVFDQKAIFESIHDLCRVGGIMAHRQAMTGVLNIMLYSLSPVFLHDIALANQYELLDFRIANRWGDTVRANLPSRPQSADDEFRSAIPAYPEHSRGLGIEDARADKIIPEHKLAKDLQLPQSLELNQMLDKAPLTNLDHPLSRTIHVLQERAKQFRPTNPGELYVLAIFRKANDQPFRVPYQSRCLADIDSAEMRQRYRAQFEALGMPIDASGDSLRSQFPPLG